MMTRVFLFTICLLFTYAIVAAQDSAVFKWEVSSQKIADKTYKLNFTTPGLAAWDLYGPNEIISEVPAVEIAFSDSSIQALKPFEEKGSPQSIKSALFDNATFKVYNGEANFAVTLKFAGKVPETLIGTMSYTYGRGEAFYPLTPMPFSVALEGGTKSETRILINSFDLNNPVSDCGDEGTEGKGLFGIFMLGLLGGFIALLTPCVFPLIPLTVSFFTKQSQSRSKGIRNALVYGGFIFLIYILLSLPFHLIGEGNPEILNNISTNVWLNLLFFVVFVVFAISFFGYFEITLPGSVSNTAGSKSSGSNFAGIFFMALTLAIVSFSCTGPILGSLLVGALSSNGGPMQLTFGMGGFGFGLALPFAIFAMFPGWLQSLPKSGGWLNTVKVVLGFLELAMAIKFLSNADLVEQWGLVKREIFIGAWIIIGILLVLYLFGKIKFPHDSPIGKFSATRWVFIAMFAGFTLYLIPGVTNSKAANLSLISGFPPPLCYSVYGKPVNCETGIEPLRDYEEAVRLAKQQNKPVLIDFTGWACVNCRRMEENVWTDEKVGSLMKNEFVVVSLYVDERKTLPAADQINYRTKNETLKQILTVGDKWATFQSENFNAVAQPQYAIISPDEKILTKTKGYTPNSSEFAEWLSCGVNAFKKK
ncbi:protein-disulfide reductase DsbD family protein [Flavitalea sp.]|nr:cytochrome c biogenesis protein CcdA [Flavitalea sp.]